MFDSLSQEDLETMEAVLREVSDTADDQIDFLHDFNRQPASRKRHSIGASRQSRHARMARLVTTCVSGCFLLGGRDPTIREFFLSPRVGALRPYSSTCHTRTHHLLISGRVPTTGHSAMWNRSLACVLDLGPRISNASKEDSQVINSALCALLGFTVLFGEPFAECWRDAWRDAKSRGLLENPYLAMQFARMAAYVGEVGKSIEFLLTPGAQEVELANVYTFVRNDSTDQLDDLCVSMTQGQLVSPDECMLAGRTSSTLNHLMRYIRTTMRNPGTFNNPASVLMVLTWLRDVANRVKHASPGEYTAKELRSLKAELHKTEQVQIMEKSRFWNVVDSMPDGKAKTSVLQLW